MQKFYSHGKLLLSGEYAILDGALGLGLPTKFGQQLKVEKSDSRALHWVSLDHESKVWFEARYSLSPFKVTETSDPEISNRLIQILAETKRLNPAFLTTNQGYQVAAQLTFPRDWGLGSSSTLLNNIANWGKVNAYRLLSATFGGSGYDIACAQHKLPVLYQISKSLPLVQEVNFKPSFSNELYFVHLNRKQNSRDAIQHYSNLKIDKEELINKISNVTEKLVACSSLNEFEKLLKLHEKLISKAIGLIPIQERLFPDYKGVVKSLGAWGGDFIMVTGDDETPSYFKEKGFSTVIPYAEMIL
ncbi:GYDIA family GHMP kinase [Maribacter aestuarii]|uniref:GYDIA family GHMP kinase n=1 Tax=Maribacter aestuarii TaxID=1130723 RepID=UPI00248B6218|nr:GYDIA family GHMP kinase [Maribacter aestuarii]